MHKTEPEESSREPTTKTFRDSEPGTGRKTTPILKGKGLFQKVQAKELREHETRGQFLSGARPGGLMLYGYAAGSTSSAQKAAVVPL